MKERKKIQEIFNVPEGYFDRLSENIILKIENLEKSEKAIKKLESVSFVRYIAIAASFIILFSFSFFIISVIKKQNIKNELDISYILDDFDIYNSQSLQNKNQIDKNFFDYYLLLDNNESIIYEP